MEKMYLCIDLKTFYASVECVERNLDPFKTNLVVADPNRKSGAICLAISPAMKALGIKNRCRIFEIPKNVKYITAMPRMKKYIDYAANVYAVYLKYIAPEDIHVYSIDEAFMDVTSYLKLYNMTAKELAIVIMNDIFQTLKITATAGIGTNMYLAKIALDITAKHVADNIGYLDETKYQKELWHHLPLTDFWQIGQGITKHLAKLGIYDMYDIAHAPEERLYKEFGINAKLLIDHAYGIEPCTIADIKNYKSKTKSLSNSQILFKDYNFEDTRIVVKEMVDILSLGLVENHFYCRAISLRINYSKECISSTGGSKRLLKPSDTYHDLVQAFLSIYDKTTKRDYPIRKISLSVNDVTAKPVKQLDLFSTVEKSDTDRKIANVMNQIKHKYGKNAILKGIDLTEAATTKKRNKLIGGHNSGEEV